MPLAIAENRDRLPDPATYVHTERSFSPTATGDQRHGGGHRSEGASRGQDQSGTLLARRSVPDNDLIT